MMCCGRPSHARLREAMFVTGPTVLKIRVSVVQFHPWPPFKSVYSGHIGNLASMGRRNTGFKNTGWSLPV